MADHAELIAGRYRLIDTVGQGGMGVVWRAKDELLGRTVAVKQVVISPNLPEDERQILRERVMREARAAARLHDPAAVTVYDVVTDGDSPYLVMELVDAATLSELVRDEGPLPVHRVASIGVALCGALESAHAAGIVHRDVKPGNVMVCANGRILLTDFGIASTQGDASITQTGLLLGSPAYISPERARGGTGGPPSDMWALGATLYTAVEGVPAYDAGGALPTLTAVVEGRSRPPERAGALEPVLGALLAADPIARPDATQAKRLLAGVAATSASPASTPATERPVERTAVLGAPIRAAPGHPAPAARPPSPAEGTQLLASDGPQQPAGSVALAPLRVRRRRGRRVLLTLVGLLAIAGAVVGGLYAAGTFHHPLAGGGGIPTGWQKDAEGPWTIYYPPSWRRVSVPGSGSAYGASGAFYERVSVSAAADPKATVNALAASKQRNQSGYHLVGNRQSGADQAELEWTEVEDGVTYHLADLAIRANGRLYQLLSFSSDANWKSDLPTFNQIRGTFRPS